MMRVPPPPRPYPSLRHPTAKRRALLGAALAIAGSAPLGCGEREASTPPLHLSDVTARTGLVFTTTSGRTPSSQILEVKGGGLALFDYDDDDDLDLFVPNGATLDSPKRGPGSRMFENDGGLVFHDVTGSKGPAFDRWGFGAAVGDVDGDGVDDLYVGCFGENALFRNLGEGRFEDVTTTADAGGGDRWTAAAAFIDIDNDGDLDLYLANNLQIDPANPPPKMVFAGVEVFGGPHGCSPEADVLLENNGDGTFKDITEPSGCGAVTPGYGLGVIGVDFDDDGTQEIFVGNDSGTNFLFHRTADGTYEELGSVSGIGNNSDGVTQATMGIAIGDVNGDLRPDVYTTNFMNDTNTLHVNLGGLLFEDRTASYGLAGVSRPFLGWATAFVDFDHDADEDLVVFNGHVYPKTITEPVGWKHDQVPQLYVREGDRFTVSTSVAGAWLDQAHCDRSAVFGDIDRDGDIDVIVSELNGPLRVLENDGARAPWMVVRLHDPRDGVHNRHGIGARVTATTGGRTQARWVVSGASYQSACPPEVHFGFGDGAGTVDLEVTWPDGHRQTMSGVAASRPVTITRE